MKKYIDVWMNGIPSDFPYRAINNIPDEDYKPILTDFLTDWGNPGRTVIQLTSVPSNYHLQILGTMDYGRRALEARVLNGPDKSLINFLVPVDPNSVFASIASGEAYIQDKYLHVKTKLVFKKKGIIKLCTP